MDTGYGDWMAGGGGSDEVVADPRLKGKFNKQTFEAVFRERAMAQTAGMAIVKQTEPDAIMPVMGTELGGESKNFTAAFGSDTQFVDIKEAYTTGSTRFHEVADVRISGKGARNVEEAKRVREAELARVDPDEKSRIAAAADHVELLDTVGARGEALHVDKSLLLARVSDSGVARGGIEVGWLERTLRGSDAAIHPPCDGVATVLIVQHGPPEGEHRQPGFRRGFERDRAIALEGNPLSDLSTGPVGQRARRHRRVLGERWGN
jgi:hypothetical protein